MDGVRDLRDDQGLLAYAVWGEGPALVFMQDLFRPLDSLDDDPRFARLLEDLGSFASLVVFDRSGIGFSDPITDWDRPLVDTWAQDLARIIEGVVGDRGAAGPHRGGLADDANPQPRRETDRGGLIGGVEPRGEVDALDLGEREQA